MAMAEEVVKPDLEFVKEVVNNGGESLKKCYQCATCSVVCKITPDDKPFPRKEMIHAQWGLKDKLFGNPDIWLCHQCSDCTAYCPRGAKPGEVLNAIRNLSIKNVALIPFLAKVAQDPKFIWLLFAVPVALFYIVMRVTHHETMEFIRLGANMDKMAYHMFIPTDPHMPAPACLKWIFGLTAIFSVLSAFVGIQRLWSGMKTQAGGMKSGGSLSGNITSSVKTILAHSKFADCSVNRLRQWGHMLLLYSFIGLAISGIWDLVYVYGNKILGIQPFLVFNFGEGPYPLTDPLKILSQISMIAFLIGIVIVLYNRFAKAGKAGMGSYFDWIFLTVISGIGATGLLALVFRLANISAGYVAFYFHLVFVWILLAYAPYSKFAHLFYRTTAMVFAKETRRE
jgi:quinone-modifying oxidoreductase subunit QmoC